VVDLYELLVHDAAFLRDSELADKVIGKGAAVLMIKGGVTRVYADVISAPALELLRTNGVDVTFQTQVANIKNRAGTDMCPVEKRCLLLTDLDEMVGAIHSFLEQQQLI
jgi:iron complex outermembrane receptor protein